MGGMSLFHWIVVLGVVLMVMGPNRFPELARALGKGIRDFKKALNEDESTDRLRSVENENEKKSA
ncbi:MAG: twin-arginine translocase TatA/TatE family subunit [Proteobacteria bacterium]|nr:twin-arginine translocase TatA/TatE family subunit [Pseudomonadota bacterium]NDG27423.1 twin-arginine translocase TatA/TatE family subunit [Pseudomonadota bacterium]